MSRSAAFLIAVGLLAGGTGEAALRPPATVRVTIDGAKFSPAQVTAHRGDTVIWTNKDILAHTVTAQSGVFDSKVIAPGATWKFVVRKTGDFPYKCSFHPMTGTLTVR